MCIAVPGTIISINETNAIINVMGMEMEAFIGLLENPKPGDNVLIHAGCAIQEIDDEYFYYLESVLSSVLEEEA